MRTGGGDHEEGFLEEESGSRIQSEERVDRQVSRPWPGAEMVWRDHGAGGCKTAQQEASSAQPWGTEMGPEGSLPQSTGSTSALDGGRRWRARSAPSLSRASPKKWHQGQRGSGTGVTACGPQ